MNDLANTLDFAVKLGIWSYIASLILAIPVCWFIWRIWRDILGRRKKSIWER